MREAVSGWEEKDQDERRGIRMIGEGSGWVKDQNKRSSIRIRGEGSEWEKQYPDKRRRIRMREAVSGWEKGGMGMKMRMKRMWNDNVNLKIGI